MYNQGEGLVTRRTQSDYSLPFKLLVIAEVEKGEITWKKAQAKYGIQGRSTVLVWLRKHGSLGWQTKAGMQGANNTPQGRIHELEARIKRLEAEKQVLNSAIDIADQQLGTNIRKKYLPQSSGIGEQRQEGMGQPDVYSRTPPFSARPWVIATRPTTRQRKTACWPKKKHPLPLRWCLDKRGQLPRPGTPSFTTSLASPQREEDQSRP